MTSEEYLRASGWEPSVTLWLHERHGGYDAAMPLAEAVEAQLAEDRARLAFVAAHSKIGLTWSDPLASRRPIVHDDVAVCVEPKEPR